MALWPAVCHGAKTHPCPAFPVCNKATMGIVSQSEKGLASYDYFLGLAIGFILENRKTTSLFFSAVATKQPKPKI